MILGVVSDTHNRIANIEKIIDIFNEHKVGVVVHTGDITNAATLRRFTRLNSSLIGVYGNNDREEKGLYEVARDNNFFFKSPPLVKEIKGKRIAVFHEPDEIEEFINNNKKINLVLHGHTHRFRQEKFKGVLIFNPGECAGSLDGYNCVGLIDLKDLSIERIFF